MDYLYFFIITILVIFVIILIVLLYKKPKDTNFDKIKNELAYVRKENNEQLRQNREELAGSIARLGTLFETKTDLQNRKIDLRLSEIQEKNEKSIEKIRMSVDENLYKTLDEKIGKSFQSVSERLEQVHKGLGEMQSLSGNINDLKKIFTNVKNRGVWGELQLERLLCGMLSSGQYIKNAVIKQGSGQSVEFAIKLPAGDETILLPIDSKFPVESYNRLINAYESAPESINVYIKELETALKKSACDIFEKYINPPVTTDYAIMFLPIEGLYLEAAKIDGLIELLQQKYKVILSGPTTLTALLNSLQMGFKTAALEKRTLEVWTTLAEIKKDFTSFEAVLLSAQKNITKANDDLDKLVGVRTRVILNKLHSLEETEKQE